MANYSEYYLLLGLVILCLAVIYFYDYTLGKAEISKDQYSKLDCWLSSYPELKEYMPKSKKILIREYMVVFDEYRRLHDITKLNEAKAKLKTIRTRNING